MPHADAESKLKNEIANIEAELQKEMPTDIHTELVGVWPNGTSEKCLFFIRR